MNKKLFYILTLLTLLPLAPAQGMKEKPTDQEPSGRRTELFPHENILGDANGPWGNILDFFEFKDLLNFRLVNETFCGTVGQYCKQTNRRVLKRKLKKELFKIKDLKKFKNKLQHLKDLVGDVWQIEFDCSDSTIMDEQLGVIVQLFKNNLQSLSLSYCEKITDEGLKHLSNLTKLQGLNLHYCKKITDEGLKKIAVNLTQLQKLRLLSCDEITDVGLEHLTKLKNLQRLSLHYCKKITLEGIRSLKPASPNLEIFI